MNERRHWPSRPSDAEWISITVYARTYGVSRVTVYKWLHAGLLETYCMDGVLRVRDVRPDQHKPLQDGAQCKPV